MKHKNGDTLVELLIAIAIFLIIMLAGMALFSYGRMDIDLSGRYRQARELAEQKLEELRRIPYSEIVDSNEQISVGGMSFKRKTTVVEDLEDYEEDLQDLENFMKIVEVEVTWTEKGQEQKIDLKTIISIR